MQGALQKAQPLTLTAAPRHFPLPLPHCYGGVFPWIISKLIPNIPDGSLKVLHCILLAFPLGFGQALTALQSPWLDLNASFVSGWEQQPELQAPALP